MTWLFSILLNLILSNANICYVASIKMKLSNKKMKLEKMNINSKNWSLIYKKLTTITQKYKFNTKFLASIYNSSLLNIKLAITELYNIISTINAKEKNDYQIETMRKFI